VNKNIGGRMKKTTILIIVSLVVMSTLACSFTVNVPTIKTGPEQTFTIHEAAPAGTDPFDIHLKLGAATIKLGGGASGLVDGTVTYNIPDWQPELDRSGDSLTITQGKASDVGGFNVSDIKNDWNLKFSENVPLNLSIDAGAYTGKMDFTNIPLRSLVIHDGASSNAIVFDAPNPSQLEKFEYMTGASTVKLEGLANTNAEKITFTGGAGTYTLDFSGSLQRDMKVKIDAGVSTIKIIVPAGIKVTVDVQGEMKTVSTQGTWRVDDNLYATGDKGNTLNIVVNTSLGTLTLVQED
jgi:hypothetical protein